VAAILRSRDQENPLQYWTSARSNSRVMPVPSGAITRGTPSSLNAIDLPSGDQAGAEE